MLAASSLPLCTDCWGELSLEHQLHKHLVAWLRSSAVVCPEVKERQLAAGHPMSCRALHRGLLGWNWLRLLVSSTVLQLLLAGFFLGEQHRWSGAVGWDRGRAELRGKVQASFLGAQVRTSPGRVAVCSAGMRQ